MNYFLSVTIITFIIIISTVRAPHRVTHDDRRMTDKCDAEMIFFKIKVNARQTSAMGALEIIITQLKKSHFEADGIYRDKTSMHLYFLDIYNSIPAAKLELKSPQMYCDKYKKKQKEIKTA